MSFMRNFNLKFCPTLHQLNPLFSSQDHTNNSNIRDLSLCIAGVGTEEKLVVYGSKNYLPVLHTSGFCNEKPQNQVG